MARTLSRRRFLGSAAAASLGFAGLRCTDPFLAEIEPRYGPLLDDREGLIALPGGFSYSVLSRYGETMSDGFLVPARHDGMAAFGDPGGATILVRNHEIDERAEPDQGAFGADLSLLERLEPDVLYDAGNGTAPALGAVTTIVFDTRTQTLVSHHLSLAGTLRNCSGGPTPWGSWLSCEESVAGTAEGLAREHGYVFEVAASASGPTQRAVPLTAMGRFNHEAVAYHPGAGVLYQTEDEPDGLLYRFLPERQGDLAAGGRLQVLRVRDRPSLDTRNWEENRIAVGVPVSVEWMDVDEVDSPDGDLRSRGFESGAARFARAEGIWYGRNEVYFACTNGGAATAGQIWRYRPSPAEGTPAELESAATLELFIEAGTRSLVANADNLTVAPWGDLIVCQDSTADVRLVGVTPTGSAYELARNVHSSGEFAGPCFSPDGSTMFVNMLLEGLTLAITGPWSRRA